MNIRKNQGITLIVLVITIIVLLIIVGVSITGTLRGHKETEEASDISELNMIQHAILQRYTKAQLTKETLPGTTETLPGTTIEQSQVEEIIKYINENTNPKVSIVLKGTEYKQLSTADLEILGVTKEDDTFIVNYKTGEVINASKKVTKSGKALYTYSKEERED